MPAPKRSTRTTVSESLTPAQAQYVVGRLLKDRRISAGEVKSYLVEIDREINALEAQLQSLRAASSGEAPARRSSAAGTAAKGTTAAPAKKRRKQNLTPERRAALKRQGHYLALMRRVPKSKRAGFSSIFSKKGAQAAIDALKKALGK